MIDRVAAALRATTDEVLLAANDPAADAWLPGVTRVPDARPGRGPLGGIHAALARAASPILVVAWDMPFVPAALLAELRRLASERTSAVVPENADGRLEPLCAWYAPNCSRALEAWLDAGESSAAGFLEQLPGVRRVPSSELAHCGDPARLFLSINTPEALRQAEAMAG